LPAPGYGIQLRKHLCPQRQAMQVAIHP
jgi:hypothetical protein